MQKTRGKRKPFARGRAVFEVRDEAWGIDEALTASGQIQPFDHREEPRDRTVANDGRGGSATPAGLPLIPHGHGDASRVGVLIGGAAFAAVGLALVLGASAPESPSAPPSRARPRQESRASWPARAEGGQSGGARQRRRAAKHSRRAPEDRERGAEPSGASATPVQPEVPPPAAPSPPRTAAAVPSNEFSFER